MKNVNDMTLEQKMNELQSNINKAMTGKDNPGSVEYSFVMNSKLGNDGLQKLRGFALLIQNSRLLLGRLDQLDYDVRNQTIRDLNNKFDNALLVFPGYTKEEQYEERRGFGR